MSLRSRISRWLPGRRKTQSARHDLPENRLRAGAVAIDPGAVFAPDRAIIESYTHLDESDAANIRRVNDNKLFYKEIPYSRYLGEWQFHPGRIGGFLTTNKQAPRVAKAARSILQYFVELPNGGLALYYPSTIRTARLQVNEPIYSGIAQGQLLAGFTRLIRDGFNPEKGRDWRDIAARIAKSLAFPFEKGGVCVDGKIVLEAPNFRACPEIILNGWMDALLHLHDYLHFVPDREMQELFERNVAALVELLPQFDAPEAKLSRYSDLCPYVFRAHFDGAVRGPAPRAIVEYLPLNPGYSPYVIGNLWAAGPPLRKCIYENKIERAGSSFMDLTLSVSGLYDTRVHIGAECARMTFDPGTFNASSTVPRRSLQSRSLTPQVRDDGWTTFLIRSSENDLIPGCPTNFMKDGENFYHLYHVVALYELALVTADPSQRKILTESASKWLAYTRDPKHRPVASSATFAEPDDFVKKIERFRVLPNKYGFEELQARATA